MPMPMFGQNEKWLLGGRPSESRFDFESRRGGTGKSMFSGLTFEPGQLISCLTMFSMPNISIKHQRPSTGTVADGKHPHSPPKWEHKSKPNPAKRLTRNFSAVANFNSLYDCPTPIIRLSDSIFMCTSSRSGERFLVFSFGYFITASLTASRRRGWGERVEKSTEIAEMRYMSILTSYSHFEIVFRDAQNARQWTVEPYPVNESVFVVHLISNSEPPLGFCGCSPIVSSVIGAYEAHGTQNRR